MCLDLDAQPLVHHEYFHVDPKYKPLRKQGYYKLNGIKLEIELY